MELRRRELVAWREGWLPAGNEFVGRRVAVQIDGGRVRLRENKKRKKNSKKKKGTRRKFDTPWREPKALVIFEFDEHGKMVNKERQSLIDGTLLGPDNLAELVAFHLHRLGVAQAELVVFISDGARWIWDRLEWIEQRAGLDSSKTVHVLDFCHAAHHISLALAALGLTGDVRQQTYIRLRKLLKRSRYDEVVSELKKRAKRKKLKVGHDVWTEIRYLETHGSEGHLQYLTFRRRGIPRGSGAIESTIRRVINLRLKSNAMYWLEENAEAMFAIRALILCERWEETLSRVRQTMACDRRINWHDHPDPRIADLLPEHSGELPADLLADPLHPPSHGRSPQIVSSHGSDESSPGRSSTSISEPSTSARCRSSTNRTARSSTWRTIRSLDPAALNPREARCQVSCPPTSATERLKRLRTRWTIERTTPRFCLSDLEP